MSQIIDEDEVGLILNDPDLIFESSQGPSEELGDVIYADETEAIFLNGHILPGETQTVILHEDEILISNEQDTQQISTNQAEMLQYIDEEGNITERQIIYVDEDGLPIQDIDLSHYQLSNSLQIEGEFPLKSVKLETEELDLEELIKQNGDNSHTVLQNITDENGYHYAILKDGKLHLQSYNGEIISVEGNVKLEENTDIERENRQVADQQVLDVSSITGRNLLTGQTVSLNSYMDKLLKRMKEPIENIVIPKDKASQKRKLKDSLNGLLNKKLTLGETPSGKRLVGKVIHVGSKDNDSISSSQASQKSINCDKVSLPLVESKLILEESDHLTGESSSANVEKYVIQRKIISKECFEHISRTLGGLMNMESVRKKLENKNILVKVIEKRYIIVKKAFDKSISYSSGYMEQTVVSGENGEVLQGWSFVPDSKTKEVLLGDDLTKQTQSRTKTKFTDVTHLTLLITYQKNKERIRVIMESPSLNKCVDCSKTFRTKLQLRFHRNTCHKVENNAKSCDTCAFVCYSQNELDDHRKFHDGQKMFCCTYRNCRKYFSSLAKLKRHKSVHEDEVRLFECCICDLRCPTEAVLKQHLATHRDTKLYTCQVCNRNFSNHTELSLHKIVHDPLKYYTCNICKRTFSRYSNLQRHVDIHKGKGDLFQCPICGCSYHYMSSLTRHLVQNHLMAKDTGTVS